jgi:hypothetical protein
MYALILTFRELFDKDSKECRRTVVSIDLFLNLVYL